jgi:hypothetical protein
MAYASLTYTVITKSADGQGNVVSAAFGEAGDPVTSATTASTDATQVHTDTVAAVAAQPSSTAVATDIATLVADGASPTQAHVNALNTAWGTFLTALTAYNTAVGTANTDAATAATAAASAVSALGSADVIILYNTTTVTRGNTFRAALRDIDRRIHVTFGN